MDYVNLRRCARYEAPDLGHGDYRSQGSDVGRFAAHVWAGHEKEGRRAKDEVEIIGDKIHVVLKFHTRMASVLELCDFCMSEVISFRLERIDHNS